MAVDLPRQIGRYEIRDRIGQGGMGVLYLALDPAIDRLVAIKVLRADFEDEDTRERFAGEARAAGRLRHPNIVTIHDVGDQDGRPYIAMEYIPGETLYELIRRRAPLPLSKKLHFVEELCRGLAYAHKAGLIHRDIKPANLMVDPEGVVKILDFGIARAAASTQLTSAFAGTPSYMSPEQAKGLPLDARSDIFSVGLVLYEVLAYRKAFPGETRHEIVNKIIYNEPEPLHTLCPGLNPRIEEICTRALQKDPAQRYQDLGVMRSDLALAREQVVANSEQQTIPSFSPGARPSSPTPARSDRHGLARRRATQIEMHVNAARAALDAGQLDDALDAAEQALILDPDEPRAVELVEKVRHAIDARRVLQWVTDGRERLRSGDLTAAEAALREALSIDSTAALALAFQREFQQARREQARLRERREVAQAALTRAREAFDAGAFESAMRAASEALAHDTSLDVARALRQEAQAAIEERRRQEAVASQARHAVEMARVQFIAGNEAGAIEGLEQFTPRGDIIEQALADLRAMQADRARRRTWIAERLESARASLDQQRPREAAAVLAEVRAIEPAADGLEELLDQAAEAVRTLEEHEQRVRVVDSHVAAATRHLLDGQLEASLERARAALALDAGHDEARDLAATAEQRIESQRRLQHEKRAQQAIDQSRRLAAKGKVDEALQELRDFAPPHPLVADALAEAEAARAAREQRKREEEERRAQERAAALEADRRREEALQRAREAAQKAEAERQAREAARKAEEARQQAAARAAEEARRLEKERLAEEARKAEAERQAREAARKAEEARRQEAARLAEEARKAEAERQAREAARKAEEARRQEAARLAEEARKAEAERQAREAARKAEEEARQKEAARIAEEARKAEAERQAREAARKAEEARRQEAARLAEEAHKAEAERQAREAARKAEEEARRKEAARLAEEARKAEAEEARQQAAARAAEEARRLEKERLAEEARKAEAERQAREAARRAEEARQKEAARLAEEAHKAEAERQAREAARKAEAEAQRKEAARLAEEARRAEAERQAREAARKAEEARQKEAARLAEAARKAEADRQAREAARKVEEEARRKEAARLAEAARKAEAERQAREAARKADEARQQAAARAAEEARRLEDARVAAERRAAEERAREEQRQLEIARTAEAARQKEERRRAQEEGERQPQHARGVEIERVSSQADTLLAPPGLGAAARHGEVVQPPVAAPTTIEIPGRVRPPLQPRLLMGAAAAIFIVVVAGWYLASRREAPPTSPESTATRPAETSERESPKPEPRPETPPVTTTGSTAERVRELLQHDDRQALSVLEDGVRSAPGDEQLTTLLLDLLRTARTEAAEARDGLLREKNSGSAQSSRAVETLQKLEQQGRSDASVDLVRDYWNVRDELTLAQVEAIAARDRAAAVDRLQRALAQHPAAPVLTQGLARLVDRARLDAENARALAARDKVASRSPEFQQGLSRLKQARPAEKQPATLMAYWSARDLFDQSRTRAQSASKDTPAVTKDNSTLPPPGGDTRAGGTTSSEPTPTGRPGDQPAIGTQVPPITPSVRPPENPPAANPPPPPPPPPPTSKEAPTSTPTDDRAQVEEVVRAYARAFGSMDAAQLSQLLANPNPERTARDFAQNRSQSMTLGAINVTFVSSDVANVSVQTVMVVEPKVAARVPPRTRLDFTMRKINGRWLITGFR